MEGGRPSDKFMGFERALPRPESAKHGDAQRFDKMDYQPTVPLIMERPEEHQVKRKRPITAKIRKPQSMMVNNFLAEQPLKEEALKIMNKKKKKKVANQFPFGLKKDKEYYYDQTMKLRQSMLLDREENLKLRTLVTKKEKEFEKREGTLEELLSRMKSESSIPQIDIKKAKKESHLIMALKKVVKELQQENRKKSEILDKLRIDQAITKITELEMELQSYEEEAERLNKLLEFTQLKKFGGYTEENLINLQRDIDQQSNIIRDIREENSQLANELTIKENELKKSSSICQKRTQKIQSMIEDGKKNSKCKKSIANNKRKIEKLKAELKEFKSKNKDLVALSDKLEELLENQKNLKSKLDLSKEYLKALRDKHRNVEKKNTERQPALKEVEALQASLKSLSEEKKKYEESHSKVEVLPLVNKVEINSVIEALKIAFSMSNIPFNKIQKGIFPRFAENDLVSILELSSVIRRFSKKAQEETLKLARYLIEPITHSTVNFSLKTEDKVFAVVHKLSSLIGPYYSFNKERGNKIKENLITKFKPFISTIKQTLESVESEPGCITGKGIEEMAEILDIRLLKEEIEYCIATMFTESKDMKKLPYKALFEALGFELNFEENKNSFEDEYEQDMKYEQSEEKESSNVKQEEEKKDEITTNEAITIEHKEEPEITPDEVITIDHNEEPEIAPNEAITIEHNKEPAASEPYSEEKSSPDEKREILKGEGEPEYVDIDEDQMLSITHKCFEKIAHALLAKKIGIINLYEPWIKIGQIDNEECELLTGEDFFLGLQSIGLNDFSSLEQACLIKVLSVVEDEEIIRVADLCTAFEEYGVGDRDQIESGPPVDPKKPSKKLKGLDFSQLDGISMILLLALTEYIIRNNIPLHDLFNDAIYSRSIKTKSQEKTLDLINSVDFFSVLHKIGIKTNSEEHENLKLFLCLDKKYPDKIFVKKLKHSIEQFATNEELRECAHKYFEEMAEENESSPEGEHAGSDGA